MLFLGVNPLPSLQWQIRTPPLRAASSRAWGTRRSRRSPRNRVSRTTESFPWWMEGDCKSFQTQLWIKTSVFSSIFLKFWAGFFYSFVLFRWIAYKWLFQRDKGHSGCHTSPKKHLLLKPSICFSLTQIICVSNPVPILDYCNKSSPFQRTKGFKQQCIGGNVWWIPPLLWSQKAHVWEDMFTVQLFNISNIPFHIL